MRDFYKIISSKMPLPLDELHWYIPLLLPNNVSFNTFLNLFHYTDINAKDQIIQKDEINFRFSRVSDFLDKNEGIHILEPFYHALGILYDKEEISNDVYKELKTIKASDICEDTEKMWVLCFSKNGNSQYMKERYAPKDGYIIGIRADNLAQLCHNLRKRKYKIDIHKVEYSRKKTEKNLIKILKLLCDSYNYETTTTHFTDKLPLKLKQKVISVLSNYAYIYKSSEYKEEQELRIIFTETDGFYDWISKDKQEKLYYKEDKKGTTHLYLNISRDALYNYTQELSPCDDFILNKSFITSKEIKNIYKEYQSSQKTL